MVESQATQGKTIKLTQVDKECDFSLERSKYQVIFDKTHNCEVFFRYKAHLLEVNKLSIGITMGKVTKEEAIETLRRGLVYAMRTGDRLVLYCGNISPDFKVLFNDANNFPTDKIFNFQEWRKEENFKKIVKEAEDVDLMGNKGCYYMNEKFEIIILQDDDDEDERKDLISKISHIDSFDIINVQ